MRSVPICETEVQRRVLRNFLRREVKAEGAAAVALVKSVRWVRKPLSMMSCSFLPDTANLRRSFLEDMS